MAPWELASFGTRHDEFPMPFGGHSQECVPATVQFFPILAAFPSDLVRA